MQASSLALADDERARLAQNGFVVSHRKRFPSFVHGYQTIYTADLPVYLSADSVLHAVHQSFDALLKKLETTAIVRLLTRVLDTMRGALAARSRSTHPRTPTCSSRSRRASSWARSRTGRRR